MTRAGLAFAVALAVAAAPLAHAQAPAAPSAAAGAAAWIARPVAEVQALDKVYARHGLLRVPVGHAARFGTLEVRVTACFVRPPDQAPDATAFLVVTDAQRGAMLFRGWMFAANPARAVLEHPVYDIRVHGCAN